jgi:hypothetical protein
MIYYEFGLNLHPFSLFCVICRFVVFSPNFIICILCVIINALYKSQTTFCIRSNANICIIRTIIIITVNICLIFHQLRIGFWLNYMVRAKTESIAVKMGKAKLVSTCIVVGGPVFLYAFLIISFWFTPMFTEYSLDGCHIISLHDVPHEHPDQASPINPAEDLAWGKIADGVVYIATYIWGGILGAYIRLAF